MAGTAFYRDAAFSIPEAQERFARHLEALMRKFTIASFHEVLDMWKAGGSVKAPTVVLTFDDGLMDQYTVAWPVMKRLGVPATFFICPEYVEKPEELYVEQIATYVFNSPHQAVTIEAPSQGSWDLRTFRARRKAVWDLIDLVKPLGSNERAKVIRDLAMKLSVDPDLWKPEHLTMDWSQIRVLAEARMEIGSHSLTHPFMAGLDPSTLEHELEESRRIVEERLGIRPEIFCYPYGGGEDFSQEVIEATSRAGYRAAVTTLPWWADHKTERFALPRVSVQLPWDKEDVLCALSPGLLSVARTVPKIRGFVYG
ncbi:MAG: polysaccharide deacetylase family protein [bacterium]|nr:polysaccharide deacetylase family protein [bacterium]